MEHSCRWIRRMRYGTGSSWERRTAGDFLRRLIAAVPYKVHTVLTDNGTHFTTPANTSSAAPDIKTALDAGEPVWAQAFEYACVQNDIDHRLTKPKAPVDQWAGRKNEPHHQGRHRQTNASTTPMISCKPTCATSSTPTTSPDASRPSKASRHMSSSEKHGLQSLEIHNQPTPANAATKQIESGGSQRCQRR